MPRRQPQEDTGPPNDWMVTFSDCMTLLLTFFVMLLSMSSFDDSVQSFLSGILPEPNKPSVFTETRLPQDSPNHVIDKPVDWTEEGSEMPVDDRTQPTLTPRAPLDNLSRDAYSDRRVVFVPSDHLFWARGPVLKPEGKDLLAPVARFVRAMPCRVVVGSTRERRGAEDEQAAARAWAVVDYFVRTAGVDPERLSLSGTPLAADPDADGAAIRIELLDPEVYP